MRAKPRSIMATFPRSRHVLAKRRVSLLPMTWHKQFPANPNHSPPMDNHEKKTAINLIRKIHHQKIVQILSEEESIIYITQPPNQLSCSKGSPRKKWCFFSLFNGGLMHYPIWRFQSQPAAWPSWYGDHHICPCNHQGYAVSFRWGLGGGVGGSQPFEKPF